MPTTVKEIMKLRQAIEDGPTPGTAGGISGLFTEQGYTVITRQNAPAEFQQIRPRVELKVSLGAATGRCHIFTDKSRAFDAWQFALAIQCVTAPVNDPSQNTQHEDFVAAVRQLMLNAAQITWTDSTHFPWHYIAEPLRDSGTADYLKAEDGVEYTTLSYGGIIGVRDTAWPSTP